MRFLADESCDFAVVRGLRESGHDVQAIAEISPRAEDSDVIRIASEEARVLLTEDKDFGRLVHAGAPSAGVVLFRFPGRARGTLKDEAARLVREYGARLPGRFVVLSPGRVRIGPPAQAQGE